MYEIINVNIKEIFNILDCHEYICVTTIITIIFLFLLIVYKITFHKYNINNLLIKVNKFNILQILYLIIIVLITFIFSHLMYNKNNKIFIGCGFIITGIILIYKNIK